MRAVLAILIVLAAVAAALFALGVFDAPTDPADVPGRGPEAGPEDPEGTGLTGRNSVPEDMPPLEALPIDEPLNVLLLAGYSERLPATLALHWAGAPNVKLYTWVENVGTPGAGSGAPAAPDLGRGQALEGPPIPADLVDLDIHVVVAHGLTGGALDAAFWEAVAERVQDGRAGLIVLPGRPEGQGLLDVAALGDVLPIARAARIEGDPVPGVLGAFRPFELTGPGATHPASRLVAWPQWSRRLWSGKAESEYPWGTSMTWPVEETTADAATLLEVVPPRGDPIPVLVASTAGSGRVLFFGAFEILQRAAFGRPEVMQDVQTWLRNWLAWAAGRAS